MPESTDSHNDNFGSVLALYEHANSLFRFALMSVVLWPAGALIAALCLNPRNVTTLVPLVAMSPMVPLFLLLIAAPTSVFMLWRNPETKFGLIGIAKVIGVELSIGVYISLVPIYNDIHMLPVFILIASAATIFWFTNFAKLLRIVFIIALLVMTRIFFAGGTAKMQKAISQLTTPTPTPTQVAATPTPAPPLPAQPSPQIPPPVLPLPWSAPVAAAPAPAPSPQQHEPAIAPPAAPDPVEDDPNALPALFPNESNLYIEHFDMDQYTIDIPPCTQNAFEIRCDFRLTNTGPQTDPLTLDLQTGASYAMLIDNLHQLHRGQALELGNAQGARVQKLMRSNVPVLASVTFPLMTFTPTRAEYIEIPAPKIVPRSEFEHCRGIIFRKIMIEANPQ